jgi:hypothetical protein
VVGVDENVRSHHGVLLSVCSRLASAVRVIIGRRISWRTPCL